MTIDLPAPGDGTRPCRLLPALMAAPVPGAAPRFNRIAYAPAHGVARRRAGSAPPDPRSPDAIDWEATLHFRPLPCAAGI